MAGKKRKFNAGFLNLAAININAAKAVKRNIQFLKIPKKIKKRVLKEEAVFVSR